MTDPMARHNGVVTRTAEEEITYALRWAIVGVVLLGAGALTGALVARTDPPALDLWWNTTVASLAPGLLGLAHIMDMLGGGWVGIYLMPILMALALVAIRRPWSALMFLAASIASALFVQLLKHLFARARPEEMLVISDFGSFPSGHTANAATIAVVAIVLFPRVWVAVVGLAWTALMAFSRTQVHAHWLTDTVGGALIGAGTALLVAAIFAVPVVRRR